MILHKTTIIIGAVMLLLVVGLIITNSILQHILETKYYNKNQKKE